MEAPPFARTVCDCCECVQCCKDQPGPLAPGDFERIAEYLGETPDQAKAHFVASPGALVGNMLTGQRRWIGTIVPRSDKTGRCTFLGADDRCTIHPVAPHGCAYFDVHMSGAEGQRRGIWYLNRIEGDAAYRQLRAQLPMTTVYKPRRCS